MPELPEVEITRRGVEAGIIGRVMLGAVVRNAKLRWPVPPDLDCLVAGQMVQRVHRRAKYLLVDLGAGSLIVHLGMSGSLQFVAADSAPGKHDHLDLLIADCSAPRALRLRDPRRFGAVLWHAGDVSGHPLLARLGPEPLGEGFSAAYLYASMRTRQTAVKQVLMDGHVIVGVGNIYASESLFRAGIRPSRPAGHLGLVDCEKLVDAVRETLNEAIAAGGSSLRDFVGTTGRPGYFQQSYFVYGRAGLACHRCGELIRQMRQGQRSTFWCPHCQPS